MTLDEAIKRYTSNAFYEKSDGNLQGYLEFNQLAEWLKELKQLREQTRWIPVSERLPEVDGKYLTYIVNEHERSLKYIMTCELIWNSISDNHWFPDDECASNNVVAWMPLPEPYKQESEKKK